jgi:putative membrane protein
VSGPATPEPDSRWPRQVYGVGTEPDPRFTFANERTFLAWIRTALGFLAAGVAIAAVARLAGPVGLEIRLASVVLIACGLASGLLAYRRWMLNERAMRLGQPLPSSRMLLVVTAVVAAVALVSVVLAVVT